MKDYANKQIKIDLDVVVKAKYAKIEKILTKMNNASSYRLKYSIIYQYIT
jgi:hypothetical protein